MILDTSYIGKKGTHLYFSGAGEVNHLGPFVDKLSPDGKRSPGHARSGQPLLRSDYRSQQHPVRRHHSALSGACVPSRNSNRLAATLRPMPARSTTPCRFAWKSRTPTVCNSWPVTPGQSPLTMLLPPTTASPGWEAQPACKTRTATIWRDRYRPGTRLTFCSSATSTICLLAGARSSLAE